MFKDSPEGQTHSYPIPVLRPTADNETKLELLRVIDSGWWGQGSKVAELEKAFAEKVGAKFAIATSSCTAALDLCLKAHNIQDGKLVTTPMTFVADAIVGEWNGMDVEFADINSFTLCLEPDAWDADVVIAVHSHGRLADIEKMRELNPGALIIEDCAHAMYTPGAGSMGDIAVWSFQAVKTMPAGDGGMVTTNDEAIAQKIRNMTWLGIEKSTYQRAESKKYSWDYDIIHGGTKSYMNDINAVLALGNLRRLDQLLEKRRQIQLTYNIAFRDLPGVSFLEDSHTVQYYTLMVENRDAISEYLADRGIATSVHFKPLSEMTYWKKAAVRPLPVTERIWPLLLSLPCHDSLTHQEQAYIIDCFKEAVSKSRT